jgi:hypothetical protein
MDEEDLYDEFGNYIGPELDDSDDSEDDAAGEVCVCVWCACVACVHRKQLVAMLRREGEVLCVRPRNDERALSNAGPCMHR